MMNYVYYMNNLNEVLELIAKAKNPKPAKSIFMVNKANKQCSLVNYKVFQNIVSSHLCLLDGSADQVEKFNRNIMNYLLQVRKLSARLPLEHQLSYKHQNQHIQRCLQQQLLKVEDDNLRKALLRPKPIEKILQQYKVKPLWLGVRSKSKPSNSNRCDSKSALDTSLRRHTNSTIKKYQRSTVLSFCIRNDTEPLVDYELLERLSNMTCPRKEERLQEAFQFLETLHFHKASIPHHSVDITVLVNNVVCAFNITKKLNLREVALRATNVEYKRESGMLNMKLRKPYTTATVWSSGKITCTGANTEEHAMLAARRFARRFQKMGVPVAINRIRVVNVLASCMMPFAIKIINFSRKYRNKASYEPELYPGVTYKIREPKTSYKIFSTGSVTLTVASVSMIKQALEHIYYILYEFRRPHSGYELKKYNIKKEMCIHQMFC